MKKTLVALLVLFSFCLFGQTDTIPIVENIEPKFIRYNIFVNGVCGGCKARIEEAALTVNGVYEVDYNIDDMMLSIRVDDLEFVEDNLHRKIALSGHDTSRYLAPDNAYDNLPGCCKYRELSQEESEAMMNEAEVDSEVNSEIDSPTEAISNDDAKHKSYNIFVKGVCGGCKARIEEVASSVKGVVEAQYNIDDNILKIKVVDHKFDESKLHHKITQAGHDTSKNKASDKAYDSLPGCCKYRELSQEESEAMMNEAEVDIEVNSEIDSTTEEISNNDAKHKSYNIFVKGVCGGCKARIEEVASSVKGVVEAQYNIDDNILKIKVVDHKFDESKLHQKIAQAGHDTSKNKASDKAYDSLPGCCKYRELSQEDSEAMMNGQGVEATEENGHKDLRHGEHEGHENEGHHHNAGIEDGDKFDVNFSDDIHEGHTHYDGFFIEGIVTEVNKKGVSNPLLGANVTILDTYTGTTTDDNGYFSLPLPNDAADLVISYIGFAKDTISVESNEYISIVLDHSVVLNAINITYKQKTTSVSRIDPYKIQTISSKELCKAACCNLSESFETNPTVDSGITDAVTGTRKIEMLGLAGPYVQITRENIPDIRGLSAIYGLSYIPGPWIEAIQLNTGTGSVINGYESLTGQINVEMKKPENSEDFFLNLFFNQGGRMEANANAKLDLGEHWSTGVLLHGKYRTLKTDSNVDGFLDDPIEKDLIFTNRWKYQSDNGWSSQFGIKGNFISHTGGQLDQFKHEGHHHHGTEHWSSDISTNRMEGWLKIGKVGLFKKHQSIGFQLSGVFHDQDAQFGTRIYDATQKSLYSNLIFQTSVGGNESIGLRFGTSFQYDKFDEYFVAKDFIREEIVPGAFMEWTLLAKGKLAIVPGIRYDYHNSYGGFVTPRIHARYMVTDNDVFRVSAGRGLKTASIFSENIGALASNRKFNIQSSNGDYPYNLEPEISWNYGVNYTKYIDIRQKEMVLSLDYYRTEFENQVVVDYDSNVQELNLYNLEGQSYSNSVQAQLDYEFFENVDFRIAYRLNDVKTQYKDAFLSKPLTAAHRAFINVAYETDEVLMFDLTLNWVGPTRIPSTEGSPYRLDTNSPSYFLVNTQVSKTWNDNFDWYLGVENLLNYKQHNPIIAADNPNDPYFDSTFIWGPIFGRMVYSGIRYRFIK